MPLHSPAPQVTRVLSPRATASAGSHQAPGLRGSCTGGPARGSRALPVLGQRAWSAGGRALPLAPRPLGRRTRRDSQNRCVVPARSAPGPVCHRRRGAALSSAFPHSPRSMARELTPLSPGFREPVGIGTEDALTAFPRRFFCLSHLGSFSICGKNPRPRRAEEEAGTPGRSIPSCLTRRFLPAGPFFLFIFPFFPLCPSSRVWCGGERRDVAGGHRGQRVPESSL